MAQFQKSVLTWRGAELLAQTQVGDKLTIRSIACGDGIQNGDLEDYTSLVGEKQRFNLGSNYELTGNELKVWAQIHGVMLTEGYYLREMGIYVADPDDPDDPDKDILYAVTTVVTGDTGHDYFIYIAPNGDPMAVSVKAVIHVIVSPLASISVKGNVFEDYIKTVNGKGPDTAGNVQITHVDVGAAAASHTHSLSSLGAASSSHTHSPSSIGAATASHTHTAADVGAAAASHNHSAADITSGTLPITRGGTGATTASAARTALDAAATGHGHSAADIGTMTTAQINAAIAAAGGGTLKTYILSGNFSTTTEYGQSLLNYSGKGIFRGLFLISDSTVSGGGSAARITLDGTAYTSKYTNSGNNHICTICTFPTNLTVSGALPTGFTGPILMAGAFTNSNTSWDVSLAFTTSLKVDASYISSTDTAIGRYILVYDRVV